MSNPTGWKGRSEWEGAHTSPTEPNNCGRCLHRGSDHANARDGRINRWRDDLNDTYCYDCRICRPPDDGHHPCSDETCSERGIRMVVVQGLGSNEKSWWCDPHYQRLMNYFTQRSAEQQKARREH